MFIPSRENFSNTSLTTGNELLALLAVLGEEKHLLEQERLRLRCLNARSQDSDGLFLQPTLCPQCLSVSLRTQELWTSALQGTRTTEAGPSKPPKANSQ